ncbi:hypothetical protein DRE_00783 [Drechslerella stenobrocha 248]|uniref:PNPLA domain-containing protein n=1 Tax=Drechslerella stenobrocha 248 TaxID=1043628 RepID=W7HQE1_9PEZI|nr:hypothetical protein DRE_00783 [Drechslerella stenobrocha 248]
MDLKKELEALAYTDPPHYLTPPHERELDILNQPNSRRLSYIHASAPPLRLLSFDGGGVKGYSSLLLLQEVMYRLFIEMNGRPPQMHEIPLPCDHFDLIGGVGTGGLIALMLGRLRMDIETCKQQWIKMTKQVFETDKTIAGITFKTTLYKASRLESVMKEIVREHTGEEARILANSREGTENPIFQDATARARAESRRSVDSIDSKNSDIIEEDESQLKERETKLDHVTTIKAQKDRDTTVNVAAEKMTGDPETLLYDPRDSRCKTFLAATYQNSPEGASPCLLRNYLSLTSLNPEPNCKIWEAGRATVATMSAFKPIQIGQTNFLDEGAGRYNVCPAVIEEATCNEWPGRAVGCVLSIGTGKPPLAKQSSHPWWEHKLHKPFDNFAEAKKRISNKTQLSEVTHQALLGQGPDSLEKWGIHKDDYFRLNIDMGESDFALNEWQKLSDISTLTRRWLTSSEGKQVIGNCALKLATIWRAKNTFQAPPPKSPLRQIPIMTEFPVEPVTPLIPRPASAAAQYNTAEPPRPSSRMRALSQIPDRQYSATPVSFAYKPISRSRTIQAPSRHYDFHKHTNSLPRFTYKDSYYTSEEEHDEAVRPRPLAVRQRGSLATSSASNSSSSITIDGGVTDASGDSGQEKYHSNSPTSCAPPDKPPVPIRRAVTVTENRPNYPYPDD